MLRLGVKRHNALIDFFKEEQEHIDERHGIGLGIAENRLVLSVFHAIGSIEHLRLLKIDVEKHREHPRCVRVRQYFSVFNLDIGKTGDGFHLVKCGRLSQKLLFGFVVPAWNKHGDRRVVRKRAGDLPCGGAAFGVFEFVDSRVVKRVFRPAGAPDGNRHDDHKQRDKGHTRFHKEPSPAGDVRHVASVRRFPHRTEERRDQSRHQEEHREHTANDALGEHKTEIVAEPELHEHERNKTGDRRKA